LLDSLLQEKAPFLRRQLREGNMQQKQA